MRLEMKYVILLMQTDLLFLTQENIRVENLDVTYSFDWRDHGIDSVFWKR
jgi:hypothetical protein